MNVLLFDLNPDRMKRVKRHMRNEGIEVIIADPHKSSLSEQIAISQPEVLLINVEPEASSLLGIIREINQQNPLPIIIYAEKEDESILDQCVRDGVGAYVVDDLTRRKIRPIIRVAITRFSETNKLRDELEKTRKQLADRKDIDRAKAIIMKQKSIDEDQAYAALRKMAMDQNLTIGEAARNIISVASLLG
jgi:response regulator NasT